MKKETVKRIRKAARATRIPPTKVKQSGKAYKRHAKHKARYDMRLHESGPFSFFSRAA